MTEEMEFRGRSVKKAVKIAAKALGIAAEDLQYDILSYGSTGIFGLAGVKKARIKVQANTTDESVEEDARNNFAEQALKQTVEDGIETGVSEALSLNEVEKVGEAVLRRMVDAISPESTIAVKKSGKQLRMCIEGGQSGILIGKRGQTLEAMQLIVDKAVRRLNGNDTRLKIDVEGYLEKKKAGLVSSAERLARKVVAKGRPASIGYLNAQDRRIIHLALKNDRKVTTKSVGEGPVRKLMIYPRKRTKNRL